MSKTTVTTYHCSFCTRQIHGDGFNPDAELTEGTGIVVAGVPAHLEFVPLHVCDFNHLCAVCCLQIAERVRNAKGVPQ